MHGSQVGGHRWERIGGHGLTFVKIEKTYTIWKVPWFYWKLNIILNYLLWL